jgi:hypothetical protein
MLALPMNDGLDIPAFLVRKDKPLPKAPVLTKPPKAKPARTYVWDTEREHWKAVEKGTP